VVFAQLILYKEYFTQKHKTFCDIWTFSIPAMKHHLTYINNFRFQFTHAAIIFLEEESKRCIKKKGL
jgi:hypothetical protein